METETLKQEVETLKREVENLTRKFSMHKHLGTEEGRVDIFDLMGNIRTVSSATELTNILAGQPHKVFEQIFIDTSTATKKLYIYDMISGGAGWKSVAIT